MSPDRKAEVNRRLRLFDDPNMPDMSDVQGRPAYPDFTTDLNALGRLEAKLPMHGWVMNLIGQGETAGAYVTLHANNGEEWGETVQPTEAQARAEAICQYLESTDKDESRTNLR